MGAGRQCGGGEAAPNGADAAGASAFPRLGDHGDSDQDIGGELRGAGLSGYAASGAVPGGLGEALKAMSGRSCGIPLVTGHSSLAKVERDSGLIPDSRTGHCLRRPAKTNGAPVAKRMHALCR